MTPTTLPTALSTTRDAWLAGNPDAWALYRSCCERLPGAAAPTGVNRHRATKSAARSAPVQEERR